MATDPNGFWDFKSYDQNTWFRFLIWKMAFLLSLYILLHVFYYESSSNYEYSKLNDEQKTYVSRLLVNPVSPTVPTQVEKPKIPPAQLPSGNSPKPDTTKKDTAKKATQSNAQTQQAIAGVNKPHIDSAKTSAGQRAIDYLETIFDNKLDKDQAAQIRAFLNESNPQDGPAFLNGTKFRVHSYFWLIGPSVYWEVYFWSIFGVLSSLFFVLGSVNSKATDDLANPRSQFDSSEIYGQIAKLFYAPLCTLCVVFSYNYFKDQNIVDISSSKGILAFSFIAGFYSSRIIALMDRLKEVLLPNNGSTTLPVGSVTTAPIAAVTIQLKPDPTLDKKILDALGDTGLNTTVVELKSANGSSNYNATRKDADPNGFFTASAVQPGKYIISAEFRKTLADNTQLHLAAMLDGQLLSGTAPIVLTMKPVV